MKLKKRTRVLLLGASIAFLVYWTAKVSQRGPRGFATSPPKPKQE